jgi:hypothetical protein
MDEKITLKKVNIIGEKFFHVFIDLEGDEIEVETTEADYKQLGQKNPNNPTKDGYSWKQSYSRLKFDTANGDLNESEYTVDKTNAVFLKKDGMVLSPKLKDISDGKLDASKLLELKETQWQ